MTTWNEILSGDVVLGADGLAWYVERQGRRFALSRPDRGTPVLGTPDLSRSIQRLSRGIDSLAIDTLSTAFPQLSIMDHH